MSPHAQMVLLGVTVSVVVVVVVVVWMISSADMFVYKVF